MIFNSFQFIWLFPLIFIGYYLLSYLLSEKFPERQRKISNALLLIVSYGLYAQTNMAYTLILLGVTLITYQFALLIERSDTDKRKKHLIACGASLALLPLLVFKYYNFIVNTTQSFLESIHSTPPILPGLNWAIPLGISWTFIINELRQNTIGGSTCFLYRSSLNLCQDQSVRQRIYFRKSRLAESLMPLWQRKV